MVRSVAPLLLLSVIAAAAQIPSAARRSAGAQAQFDVLHTFPPLQIDEVYAPLIRATDGNLYGMTYKGGTSGKGAAFRMTLAGVVTYLHAFAGGSDGAYPIAGLMQATDGNFYGTTWVGGASDLGTVFRMTPAGAVTVLHAFAGGADGQYPYAGLIQVGGTFYGTTLQGGTGGSLGTVFTITPAGAYAVLHSFSGGADGAGPAAALLAASDGNLYGSTAGGGAPGQGTVFKCTLQGAVTVLHAFSGADGSEPWAALIQATDGNFYGTTTYGGGAANAGTVFRMTPGGTTTILHEFGSDALNPVAGLVQATDGYLYGTTMNGIGPGAVFRVAPDGTFTSMLTFGNHNDGYYPTAGLVQAADGNLYGTTSQGLRGGTAFRMTLAGIETVLHEFNGNAEGAEPNSLLRAADGNFYGTARRGGVAGYGTVFKMTAAGTLTVVYEFTNGPDGASPGNLIQTADGSFYGTAGNSIFRMTPTGALTIFHAFGSATDPGGEGPGRLFQANDGTFYGLTNSGGDYLCGSIGCGTAFSLTPGGMHTVLHSFNGGGDGAFSEIGLTQGADGNFYGVTPWGGGEPCMYTSNGCGTLFKMTSAGDVTVLQRFSSTLGLMPSAPVVQASNGKFYGTASMGGTGAGGGVVFEATSSGGYGVVHHFTGGADGGRPAAALIQAPDGWLYGTTPGSVFRTTMTGIFDVVYTFTGGAGDASPALVRHTDGSFYGVGATSTSDGAVGIVYRVRKTAQPFTDDPLVAGAAVIKAVHITELRSRIDAVRQILGLTGYGWTDALTAGASAIRALHVTELRTALDQAYTRAALTPPTYTDPNLGAGLTIKAVHLKELRDAVVAIE